MNVSLPETEDWGGAFGKGKLLYSENGNLPFPPLPFQDLIRYPSMMSMQEFVDVYNWHARSEERELRCCQGQDQKAVPLTWYNHPFIWSLYFVPRPIQLVQFVQAIGWSKGLNTLGRISSHVGYNSVWPGSGHGIENVRFCRIDFRSLVECRFQSGSWPHK